MVMVQIMANKKVSQPVDLMNNAKMAAWGRHRHNGLTI